MFFDSATNAACPERSAWKISKVGYKWAQTVFHGYNEDTNRFELKPEEKSDSEKVSCCVVIGCCIQNAAKAG